MKKSTRLASGRSRSTRMPVWMSERLERIALLDELLHLREQLLHRRDVVRRAGDEDLVAARGDLHARTRLRACAGFRRDCRRECGCLRRRVSVPFSSFRSWSVASGQWFGCQPASLTTGTDSIPSHLRLDLRRPAIDAAGERQRVESLLRQPLPAIIERMPWWQDYAAGRAGVSCRRCGSVFIGISVEPSIEQMAASPSSRTSMTGRRIFAGEELLQFGRSDFAVS